MHTGLDAQTQMLVLWPPAGFTRASSANRTQGAGDAIDQCGRLKGAIFNAIDVGLRINLAYTVQDGFLDFGTYLLAKLCNCNLLL